MAFRALAGAYARAGYTGLAGAYARAFGGVRRRARSVLGGLRGRSTSRYYRVRKVTSVRYQVRAGRRR